MSSQFYAIVTDLGASKIASAISSSSTVGLVEAAVGDSNGTNVPPDPTRTTLINEVYRANLNSIIKDPLDNTLVIAEFVIPNTEGGWFVRELGIFDSDGDMIVYANFPDTYKAPLSSGVARELSITVRVKVQSSDAVTFVADPSVTYATINYVDSSLAAHEASNNHPYATTEAKGMVELATIQEAKDGLDNIRAVTPDGLSAHVNEKLTINNKSVSIALYFMGQN